MVELSKNEAFDNIVEALAPRIEIQWEPRDDSGTVLFHMERFNHRISDWYVLERSWMGTMSAPIQAIAADTYTYTHPVTGEVKTCDGFDVLAIVKAVTDRRYQLAQAALEPTSDMEG